MTYYPKIGSVSEGTMRTEDLIPTLAGELKYHMKRMRLTRDQRKRFSALVCESDTRDMNPDFVLDDLFDALDEIAPPYCTFGASDGDGASYGFWPCLGMGGDTDDLPKLGAGDDISREHWGEDVLIVNDHGNVDCGHVDKRGRFKAYWSIT